MDELNRVTVSNINLSFTMQLTRVRNILNQLIFNPNIMSALAQDSFTIAHDMPVLMDTRLILNTNSDIHSISYFAAGREEFTVYANYAQILRENPLSSYLMSTDYNPQTLRLWASNTGTGTKIAGEDSTSSFLSLTRNIKGFRIDSWAGGISINILADMWSQDILGVPGEGQVYYVIDPAGQIIMSTDLARIGEQSAFDPDDSTVFIQNSDQHNYRIVAETRFDPARTQIQRGIIMLLGLALLIIIGLLLIAIYVSGRIYEPLGMVIARLQLEEGQAERIKADPKLTDVDFLNSYFSRMQARLTDLHGLREEGQVASLLNGHAAYRIDPLREWLDKKGLRTGVDQIYCLLYITVDAQQSADEPGNLPDTTAAELHSISRQSISSILDDLLSERYQAVSVSTGERRQVWLIQPQGDETAEALPAIILQALRLAGTMVKGTVTAVLSDAETTLERLPSKLGYLHEMSRMTFLYTKTNALFINHSRGYRYLQAEDPDSEEAPLVRQYAEGSEEMIQMENPFLDDLVRAARGDSDEAYERELNQMIELARQKDSEAARLLLARAARAMDASLATPTSTLHHEETALVIYLEMVRDYSSVGEIFEDFRNRRMALVEALRSLSEHNSQDELAAIVRKINQDYADPNLSAQMLADLLGVSAPYFSRIFREYTNASVPEYITQIRLDHAKRILLDSPDITIEEVAAASGILNATYFGKLFKKHTGMSPSKYRMFHNHQT